MNPDFAVRLATAIQQARKEGIQVGLLSGFREPSDHPSNYDLAGNSSHEYGLAGDVSGIGAAGSSTAARWRQIAEANGLSSPYDPNGSEWNHWQIGPKLETNQPLLNALKAGKMTGDLNKMWAAFDPTAVANTVNTGTGGPIAQGPDNRTLFFNAFVKAGLSPQQALGALWSMGGESHPNIDTGAWNPNDPGGAFGAVQWTDTRKLGLQRYAASLGKPATDPQTQADYLIQGELLGKLPQFAEYQKGAWDALRQAKTPEDAARVWTSVVERPKYDNSDQRIRNGGAVGSIDANGNFVPGTAKAASPVAASGAPGAGAGGAGAPPAQPPSDMAQIGSALSSALSGLVANGSGLTGGTGTMTDSSMDQPAIRTPAMGADFMGPAPSPVPANIAVGAGATPLASQLGSLAATPGDPMLENPNVAPSITSGAPSMTALLGGVGGAQMGNIYDPRRPSAIQPGSAFPRIG
jgi:hypothetical protein